jgi:hypothetical protein
MVWRVCVILIVAISFSIVVGDFETSSKMSFIHNDKVIATVNNEKIYESDLTASMKSTITSLSKEKTEEILKDPDIREQIENRTLEKLIHNELLIQAAEDEKYSVSADEVSAKIDSLKSSFNTEEDFKRALEKHNLTYREFEKKVKEELLIASYLEHKIGNMEATPDQDEMVKEEQQNEQLIQNKKIELFIRELKKENKIEIHI